jgi:hypothetical protein
MAKAEKSEKMVPIAMPLSLWSWCREEAVKLGFRGVKPYVLSLVEATRRTGGAGDVLTGNDGGSATAAMTNRELTDKKQQLIDDWVLSQLEDIETLSSLPKQTKAAIILARLPKMGVSKGEMEEKALSLRAALKGLGEYEDIQGELVTLREEVRRLRKSADILEAELRLVKSDEEFGGGELARKFLDLSMQWRDMIGDALTGRDAAKRCGMLRKKALEEVWEKAAMQIAGVALDTSLVTEKILPRVDEEED